MKGTRYHLVDATARRRWPTPREWFAAASAAAAAAAGAVLNGSDPAVAILFAVGAGLAVVGGLKGRTTK